MRLELVSEAQAELRAAALYYERQLPGLGATFLSEVESAFSSIRSMPEVGISDVYDTRKHVLTRFPFNVFYSVHGQLIVIVAIAHHRRRPRYWSTRVDH